LNYSTPVPLIPMFLSFLFYAFLIYLVYRLVFGFIIPVVRTTRQVKRGFRDMQERMQQQGQPQGSSQQNNSTSSIPRSAADEDYIEFEEVRD
jgi:hypothetical protein